MDIPHGESRNTRTNSMRSTERTFFETTKERPRKWQGLSLDPFHSVLYFTIGGGGGADVFAGYETPNIPYESTHNRTKPTCQSLGRRVMGPKNAKDGGERKRA